MTQPVLLTRALFPSLDAMLEVSSQHFVWVGQGAAASNTAGWTAVSNGHIAFYNNNIPTQEYNLVSYMSHSINHAACTIECYDITDHLDGSAAGAPTMVTDWSFTPGSTTTVTPEGVAAVISFSSAYGTDPEHEGSARPRATHRNRIFFGPLSGFVLTNAAGTGRCIFTAQFCEDMISQLNQSLHVVDTGSNSWDISQWSKKMARVLSVTDIWMDNRPDYQRRRATQSTLVYGVKP
jgi:hypothetical protein